MDSTRTLQAYPSKSSELPGQYTFTEDNGLRRHSVPLSAFRLSLSSNDIRNNGREEVFRRVRSFKKTSKGIENKGDFLRKGSSGSVISSGCKVTPAVSNDSDIMMSPSRSRLFSTTSNDSGVGYTCTSGIPSYFRVLVLGASGVGKSVLINQFMSSENGCGTNDVSDGSVSVMVDDEESLVEFCNCPENKLPDEDIYVDAYVVVFSITDQESYHYATNMIKYLRDVIATDRSVIAVGNKTDLVRNRAVDRNDARLLASYYGCKYVETSVSLNHQVDDLLVGIVSQIRLKLSPDKLLQHIEQVETRLKRRHGSLKSAKTMINKLFNRQKSLSCDNLYDL